MTQHNVGALVVVKPEEEKAIAGIITERGAQSAQFRSLLLFVCVLDDSLHDLPLSNAY